LQWKSNKYYIFLEIEIETESVYVCVGGVALVIQHANRMRHVTLSAVACLVAPYFFTLSQKRHDFLAKVVGHEICVLIFSTIVSGTFFILRII
jgi:hypothetical protein